MFDMFSAVACSRPKRRSSVGAVVGRAWHRSRAGRRVHGARRYRGRNGNSRLISAASGRRPYSQISNASACCTFAPASAPYVLHQRRAHGGADAARRAASPATACRAAGSFGTLVEPAVQPRQPLVHLRHVRVDHVDLLLEHVVDRHGHVGRERVRLLEAVLEVHEHRVLPQRRRVGATLGTVTMNAASCSRTPV